MLEQTLKLNKAMYRKQLKKLLSIRNIDLDSTDDDYAMQIRILIDLMVTNESRLANEQLVQSTLKSLGR